MQTGSNQIGRSKKKTSHTRDGALSLAGSETTIEHGLAMLKEWKKKVI